MLSTQVVLTVLAAFERMNEDLIWNLHQLQVMSTMALLSTGFLAAWLPQALDRTTKAIAAWWQTTVVTIFGLLTLKRFDAPSTSPSSVFMRACSDAMALMACLSPARRS
jgi:hypothetical protein